MVSIVRAEGIGVTRLRGLALDWTVLVIQQSDERLPELFRRRFSCRGSAVS